MHEFTSANVHADVIDTLAGEAEEHEIAGTQRIKLDAHAAARLIERRARNRDAFLRINVQREAGTVEALSVFAAVAIALAELAQRMRRDQLARRRGWRGRYGRTYGAGREKQEQAREQRTREAPLSWPRQSLRSSP
jgi:hypothetical protein